MNDGKYHRIETDIDDSTMPNRRDCRTILILGREWRLYFLRLVVIDGCFDNVIIYVLKLSKFSECKGRVTENFPLQKLSLQERVQATYLEESSYLFILSIIARFFGNFHMFQHF